LRGAESAFGTQIGASETISLAAGKFAGAGIRVGGLAFTSTGVAYTLSTFAGAISLTGNQSTANIGIAVSAVSAFTGGIVNSGTISRAAGSGSATGVSVTNVSTFAGGIRNSGTIDVNGGKFAGDIVVSLVSAFSGDIVNDSSGRITAGRTGVLVAKAAIDVSTALIAVPIDQNGGTITGDIKLSANGDTLNLNGGKLLGSVVGQASTGTVNFNTDWGGNPAFAITDINALNVLSGFVVLDVAANSAVTATVGGGNLQVGDVASPLASLTTGFVAVNGGILSGHGTVNANVAINSAGSLVPGSAIGIPGTLNVNGNLTFASGAGYVIFVTPATSSTTSVTGTAALNGTMFASFLSNTRYSPGSYTILTTTGGRGSTTFAALNSLGLSPDSVSGVRNPHLTYDPTHAFLVLDQGSLTLSGGGGTGNSNAVGNAINGFINGLSGTGTPLPPNFQPLVFLTGSQLNAALSSLSGESNTGSQQAAAQLMTDYFNAVFNQMLGVGGGTPGGAGGLGATGFAPERVALPDDVAMAYASILKAPPKAPAYQLGWGVWGSGFGGYNKTNGDPVFVGSGNLTARAYGFAAGLDYRFSRDTTLGVSLAAAGTNWSVAGSGNGSSDAVQAAVYGVHHWGAAYVAGALAFTNHWMTTDRFAVAGDYLLGVTPNAALQSQRFHTPAYTEADLTGGGFGLSFASRHSTDTRSELGARFDKAMSMPGSPAWTVGGRLAWAHDWVSNPSLAAVFQTLPGAGFTVNGAAPTHNAALASLGS
jgi:hypothetical protein